MSVTDIAGDLSKDQIEQFWEDGYLFLPKVYDQEKVERFRDEADRILELLTNSTRLHNRKSRRLNVTEDEDGAQTVFSMLPFFDLSLLFKRVATDDLPELLRPLMDDEPIALSNLSQLNYKQELSEPLDFEFQKGPDRWPVHSDWATFKGWGPEGMFVTVVFVDECTEENGALKVWPGTHEQEFEHKVGDEGLEVSEEEFENRLDNDDSELILGPAGSVLLFDSRLVHSSGPNESDGPRRLLTYRHGPKSNVEATIKAGTARPTSPNVDYPPELIESPYENEYLRQKRAGELDERFNN